MSRLISTWMVDRVGIPAAIEILHGIGISPAYYCARNKNKISCVRSVNNVSILCLRPYHIESTSSRLITEVKQCRG